MRFALVLLVATAAFPQSNGITFGVTGTIFTPDGRLAIGAQACVIVPSKDGRQTKCGEPADEQGRFSIELPATGNYQIFAVNVAEGYPPATQTPGDTFALTRDHAWRDVSVHMHPKGGILSGSITDRSTGKPIPTVSIHYIGLDGRHSGAFLINNGAMKISLPTHCDLVLTASSEGYKGWVFSNPANPQRPAMQFSEGETKELDIQLDPITSPATNP